MILTEIVDALKHAGIDAYLPGRAPDERDKAYAVAADGGRERLGRTTGRRMFYVTCYVPEQTPGALAGLVRKCEDALIDVRGLRATGDVSEDDFDEEKRAYFATIEYYTMCAMV